jgi:hypothetical protein
MLPVGTKDGEDEGEDEGEGEGEEDEDEDEEGSRATWTWLTYRSNSWARSRARVPWLKPVTYRVVPPRDMVKETDAAVIECCDYRTEALRTDSTVPWRMVERGGDGDDAEAWWFGLKADAEDRPGKFWARGLRKHGRLCNPVCRRLTSDLVTVNGKCMIQCFLSRLGSWPLSQSILLNALNSLPSLPLPNYLTSPPS